MPSTTLIERYVAKVITYRWLVVLASMLVAAVSTAGVSRLVFEGNYEIFFDDENPMLMAYHEMEDVYTRTDSLTFVLAPAGGDVFARSVLVAIAEMTEEAWKLPHSRRVNSLTNYQYTKADGDDLLVGDLFPDPETMSPAEIDARRRAALSEPMLIDAQVSPKGDVTGISVSVFIPEDDPNATTEIAFAGQAFVSRFAARYPDMRIHLTGSTVISQAFNDASQGDLMSLIPLMYVVMLVILGILLRSAGAIAITFVVMAASAGTGLGLATWAGLPMTGPSTSAVTITLMIAVANMIHLLTKFEDNLAEGMAHRPAVARALVSNAGPISLACLTTAIGFLVLNTSDLPPYRFLGTTAALGVAAVLFFCFTLAPALMAIVPRKSAGRSRSKAGWVRFSNWVASRQIVLFWGSLVVVTVLSLFVTRNEFNDQFVGYFEPDAPVRADAEFTSDRLTGIYSAVYSVPSKGPGGVSDPEFLRYLDDFGSWARSHPLSKNVVIFTDVMKRLNRSMHGDDEAWYRVPEDRDLAAQYLLLYEMSLPLGMDLTNQIDIDKSSTRVRVGLPNITNNEIIAFEQDADAWMRANWPDYMITSAANPTILFAHIWDIGSKSLIRGLLIAVVVIAILIAWAMKDVKMGLLSLAPNLLPAAMAFGLWGLIDGRIDISASTVAAISFGIIIDDTIHFLARYRRGRLRENLDPAASIKYAFTEVGSALLYTTIVITVGFAVLTQSAFGFSATLGILTAITVTLALLLDFLFLPAMLMRIEARAERKQAD